MLCLIIIWEDIRFRQVRVLWLCLLSILLVALMMAKAPHELLSNASLNGVIVLIMVLSIRIVSGSFAIGGADVWMLLNLGIGHPTMPFIRTTIISATIGIMYFLILRFRRVDEINIPMAAIIATLMIWGSVSAKLHWEEGLISSIYLIPWTYNH